MTGRLHPMDPPPLLSQQVTEARRFCLSPTRAPVRGLAVACAGFEACAPNYRINRATFPYWSVEFVAAGAGHLVLGGTRFPLYAGAVFTYGPGVVHRIRSSGREPLQKYFADFIGGSATTLLRETGLSPGVFRPVTEIGEVRDAFETMVRLGMRQHEHTAQLCALQLRLLAYTIARSPSVRSANERRAHLTFERCRQNIDAGFHRYNSVEDIAVACDVDPSHLCRLFRRFHGESPLRYLQRLRMQWAAARLQEPPQLVRDVARQLMTDPYQFCRVFKRIHGVTPTEYLAGRTAACPRSLR